MPKLPLENTTLAVLTHSDAEVSALVVTEDSGKRKFLKYGAASALALSVSACGGGETLSSAEDTPPDDAETNEATPVPSEPIGEIIDLDINPDELVAGSIDGTVLLGGVPLQNATVSIYRLNGSLIGRSVTDTQGVYRLTESPLACMRIVVSYAGGSLSAFERSAPGSRAGATQVSVLSTLVDRLRLKQGWTVSQAEDRVQDFLSIPRLHSMLAPLPGDAIFNDPVFLGQQQASALTMDTYLDNLVEAAASDDFLLRRMSFKAPEKMLLQNKEPKSAIDIVTSIFGYAGNVMSVVDAILSDETKAELFDGWFVKLGILHVDTVGIKLDEIHDKLLELDVHITEMRNRIEELEINAIWSELTSAYRPIYSYGRQLKELMQYSKSGNTTAFNNLREEMIAVNGTFYEANRYFDDIFMIGVGPRQGGKRVLLQQFANYLQKTRAFWSADTEAEYLCVLGEIRTYNLVLGLLSTVYLSLSKRSKAEMATRLELIAKRDRIFRELMPRPLLPLAEASQASESERQFVFIAHGQGNAAWYVSPKLDELYSTWKGAEGGQDAYTDKLPASIRAMGRWSPPRKNEVQSTFFAPISQLPKKQRDFREYVLKQGAPSSGFYHSSQSKRQPKQNFNIWLDEVTSRVEVIDLANRNYAYKYYWNRAYARLGNLDFTNNEYRFYCPNMNRPCTFDEAKPNKSKNYVYPICRELNDVESYLPWLVFSKVQQESNGFVS